MLAIVSTVDDGFFYGADEPSVPRDRPAPPAEGRRTMVAVEGLRAPLQYSRMRVEHDHDSREHLLVGTHFPRVPDESLPQLRTALAALFPTATITFLVESVVGEASVRAAAPASGGGEAPSVAAAVATWMFAGSWDETDPIVVHVDERPLAVRVERVADRWHASVTTLEHDGTAPESR